MTHDDTPMPEEEAAPPRRPRRKKPETTPHDEPATTITEPAAAAAELEISTPPDALLADTVEEIAVEAPEVAAPGEELLLESNDPADAVQELEVEIRNHAGADAHERNVAAEALRLIRENLERMTPPAAQRTLELLQQNVLNNEYLQPDFWKGIGMVLQYQVEESTRLIQRRARGEYTLDAYGMDAEMVEIVRPFAAFLYRTYWRISVQGLDHVPAEGAALLVANHAGILPWDSMMIATSVLEEHSTPRLVRTLSDTWLTRMPGFGTALTTFGQVPARLENTVRLLEDGELALAFPEGAAGAAKLIWNRYRLAPFVSGDFVRAALQTGAPLIPVAVIGSEEAYPTLGNARPVAQLLGMPFFPLTPFFPWLGVLGMVPLPNKWEIVFGEPIDLSGLGAQAARDDTVVTGLVSQIRDLIQAMLDEHAGPRRSIFR